MLLALSILLAIAAGFTNTNDSAVEFIEADGGCPEGFFPIEGGVFCLSHQKASFMDCQDLVCGPINSTLAVLDDANTSATVFEMFKITSARAWVGLYEVGGNESGDWAWISTDLRTNVTPLWAPGEPNEACHGDEDCAMLQTEGFGDAVCIFEANCLCQTGGNFTTEEYNTTKTNLTPGPFDPGSNNCVVQKSVHGHVALCFWYWDLPLQVVWFLLAMPCFGATAWVVLCTLGATIGVRTIQKYRVDGADMLAPSPYGRLLDIPSSGPDFDGLVGFWVMRAARGEMLYAVFLLLLAFTLSLHVKGESLDYWIDAAEAVAMAVCKLIVGLCACAVRCHLAPTACAVAGPWLPLLAVSKVLMSVCALALGALYSCMSMWGTRSVEKNCLSGYFFSWSLLVVLVLQCISGVALFMIHERAVGYMGEPSLFSRVLGPWWSAYVFSTFASGLSIGVVCALFVFDDPHDNIDPFTWIGVMFTFAAMAQFLNGFSLMSASKRVEAYIASTDNGSRDAGRGHRTVEMTPQ